jgi:hypothetical protein
MGHADGRGHHASQIAGASTLGKPLYDRVLRFEDASRESAPVPWRDLGARPRLDAREATVVARDGDRSDIRAEPFGKAAGDELETLLPVELPRLRPRGRA